MNLDKHVDYIEKFRKEHLPQIGDYVKPAMKSEKVFSVGYDIRPFNICALPSGAAFTSNLCFS